MHLLDLRGPSDAAKFFDECAADRRHFIEECFKVQHREATGMVPLLMNRVQDDYWSYLEEPWVRILKARQITMSTIIQADFVSEAMWTPGLNVLVLVQKPEDKAKKPHMDRINNFYHSTPKWLRPTLHNENESTMVFRFQDKKTGARQFSHIYLASAGSLEIGRGETIHRVHRTELGSWNEEELEATSEMMLGLPKNARVRDEGTSRKVRGPLYELWQRAKLEQGVKPVLYPWWWCEDYVLDGPPIEHLTEHEAMLMLKEGLVEGQIRWRRWAIARASASWGPEEAELRFLQEYLENDVSCFLLAGLPVYDTTYLQQLLAEAKPAVKSEWNGNLQIWLPPRDGETYVIGADPSQGLSGGHPAAATVRNARTWQHCGRLLGRMPSEVLAGRLAELGDWYNSALIGVERNNHGHTVLLELDHLDYPFIYRHYKVRGGDDALGFPVSNHHVKADLIDSLGQIIRTKFFHTWDQELIGQLLQVQETPRASASGSDTEGLYNTSLLDLVSAELIALACKNQAVTRSRDRAPTEHYGMRKHLATR